MESKKVTILDLRARKREGIPITMLTAYDYPSALVVDRAGIDVILVGDSLAMVVLGHETTLPVSMEEMLHHCRAVRRGARRALLVGDMPFLSYQADVGQAVTNAGRFLKEAGMDAVKLEGGREMAETIRAILDAGIPVMGHLGLTPQSIHKLGGYKVQGKDAAAAKRLMEDARILEEAGCFSIVLEAIPAPVAERITRSLSIPTIGIGAGPGCDGQVLVLHDLLGMFERFTPRFVKKYANLFQEMTRAIEAYRGEVLNRSFPGPEHTFKISEEELAALEEL
ncbi:MAG: 3-methyl-2-oxobutanoate hydroxymethyltransferase [Chloroflexi bacterium]|nr:3-methyl-2-oxobutanoate hydroxymethyltransferase [Chloroflexota bacterium]